MIAISGQQSQLVNVQVATTPAGTNENIPYLAEFIGDDHLAIGSDYGHNDPVEEKALVQTMRSREDLSAEVVERILVKNPKTFYSL